MCCFWLLWCRHDLQDAAFLYFPLSTVKWLRVNGLDDVALASESVTYIAEVSFLRFEALREEDSVRVWEELPGKQCFASQQYTYMSAVDLNKVKDQQGPWEAFVVYNRTAYFKNKTASECYDNLVDEPHSTTYVWKEERSKEKSEIRTDIWSYLEGIITPGKDRTRVAAHTSVKTWRLSGMLFNVGAIEWAKDALCLNYQTPNKTEHTESIVTSRRLPGETQDFQIKLFLPEQAISKVKMAVINFTVCECASLISNPNANSSNGLACNSGPSKREVHRWHGGALEFQEAVVREDVPRQLSKVPLCIVLRKLQDSICITVWLLLGLAVARVVWEIARPLLGLLGFPTRLIVAVALLFYVCGYIEAAESKMIALFWENGYLFWEAFLDFHWEVWLLPAIFFAMTILVALVACQLHGAMPNFTDFIEEILDRVLVRPSGGNAGGQRLSSSYECRFWAWVVLVVLVLHAIEDCLLHGGKFILCQCANPLDCEDSRGFAKALAFIGMVASPCYWLCLYHLWESGLLSPVPLVRRDQIESAHDYPSSPMHKSTRFEDINSITSDLGTFIMPVWMVGVVGLAVTMWLSSRFHLDGQIDPLLGVGVYGSRLGRHYHVMFLGELVHRFIGIFVRDKWDDSTWNSTWKLPEHFQIAVAPATRAVVLFCLAFSGRFCITRVLVPSQRPGLVGRVRDLALLLLIPFHIYIAITWWGGGFAPRMLVTFTYYRHCLLLRRSFNSIYYKVTGDPEHQQGHARCDFKTAIAEYTAARWANKWGMLQFGERLRYAWAAFTLHTLLVVMIDSVGSMDEDYEDQASMARAAVAANRIFLQLYVSGKAWYMASMLIKSAGNFYVAPLERATWIVERPWKRDDQSEEHVTRDDCLAFARYAKHSAGALWHFGVVRIGSGFATALMQVLVVSQASKLGAIFTVYKASDLLHGVGYFTR